MMSDNRPIQEINLKPYVQLLWKRAVWIVAAALLAASAYFVYVTLQPEQYRASALVVLRQPKYSVNFDSKIIVEANEIEALYDAMPSLAKSDGLLRDVIENTAFLQTSDVPLESVRNALDTNNIAKPTLIRLSAELPNAVNAAALTNTWATLFVEQMNDVYTNQSPDQLRFFTEQLATAQAELTAAEDALTEFAAQNDRALHQNELDALLQEQDNYLTAKSQIQQLLRDIESYQTQLDAANVSLTNGELTPLLLELRAFNAASRATFQIQLADVDATPTLSPSEQRAFLSALAATMTSNSAELDALLAELGPQVLELQRIIQESSTEETRLKDAINRANESVVVLARTVNEVRVAADERGSLMQLASAAEVPQLPLKRDRLQTTIIAGMAGAAVAIFVIFFIEWWKAP
ncbi:MAG: Wzz/FepE/Etk N-terminal domain-containing protein [Anaerolineae bacterium]|nr:Wzz/FepE/Etk N-terminal domain-containing protein [Anaerolineae bacterium]MCO5187231.1 Wzz/FepE/Etk N-terminal domain-containing protein [Anaerolineae bacterium]